MSSSSLLTIGNKLPLYVAAAGSGKKQGIIVIQEWWGLNDQIKAITDRIAVAGGGFKAVAPDLYHGKSTSNPDEANHLMGSLDWPGAMKDIQSTVDWLKEAGCGKIAILGFCMGGALSIASAVRIKGLDAAVCFYGVPGRDFAKAEEIKCPLLCHFGSNDKSMGFSDPKTAKDLEHHLSLQSKHSFEVVIHDGADHAFMNEKRPEVYNETIAKKAMDQSMTFIHKVFGGI